MHLDFGGTLNSAPTDKLVVAAAVLFVLFMFLALRRPRTPASWDWTIAAAKGEKLALFTESGSSIGKPTKGPATLGHSLAFGNTYHLVTTGENFVYVETFRRHHSSDYAFGRGQRLEATEHGVSQIMLVTHDLHLPIHVAKYVEEELGALMVRKTTH